MTAHPDPELRALLDARFARYHRPGFVEEDPVQIPHLFLAKEDIEIAGFFAATLAWGRRPLILRSARRLMALMDDAPFGFVRGASEGELARLDGFVHRTFNGTDARHFVRALRMIYAQYGGLEGIFSESVSPEAPHPGAGLVRLREVFFNLPDAPKRTGKHVSNILAGSAAKRLNMYLRWMCRSSGGGVDFGLWARPAPRQLVCPLDVHTGRVARALGLLERKSNDWKAALELTENLRAYCPEDPVRYDLALFGMGVYGEV